MGSKTEEVTKMRHAAFPPKPSSIALALVVCAVLFAGAAPCAIASEAGPFEVEGPAGAFSYKDSTLTISGEGVTIVGTNASSSAARNVHIKSGVSGITLGPNVEIGSLTDEHSTTITVEGGNNSIASLSSQRDTRFNGTGSVVIGTCSSPFDVTEANVTIASQALSVLMWRDSTVTLEPGAKVAAISQFGGTLDLSRLSEANGVDMIGYSIGSASARVDIIVPFGTIDVNDLLHAEGRPINSDAIDVYSNGELVGLLQQNGKILYTATRTVVFVGWDGRVLESESVCLFQSAVPPDVADRPGYEFVGWDRAFDHVEEDMTVVAVFEPIDPSSDGSDDSEDPERPGGAGEETEGSPSDGRGAEDRPGLGGDGPEVSSLQAEMPQAGDEFAVAETIAAMVSFGSLVLAIAACRVRRSDAD